MMSHLQEQVFCKSRIELPKIREAVTSKMTNEEHRVGINANVLPPLQKWDTDDLFKCSESILSFGRQQLYFLWTFAL